MRAKDEQKRWRTWNQPSHRPIVEMVVNSLSISAASQHGRKLSMKTDVEGRSRLLAMISDLLDTLLEDWQVVTRLLKLFYFQSRFLF